MYYNIIHTKSRKKHMFVWLCSNSCIRNAGSVGRKKTGMFIICDLCSKAVKTPTMATKEKQLNRTRVIFRRSYCWDFPPWNFPSACLQYINRKRY